MLRKDKLNIHPLSGQDFPDPDNVAILKEDRFTDKSIADALPEDIFRSSFNVATGVDADERSDESIHKKEL